MGAFLAQKEGVFRWSVFLLSILTTLFLQVLSNLANDYGDAKSGVDSKERSGPQRMVQSGKITATQMKQSLFAFSFLSLASGLLLLWISFPNDAVWLTVFLIIGLGAIGAAIKYTVGKKPYGYSGFGDVFVLIFFGWVGVIGSYFLHAQHFEFYLLLPATAFGLLAVGVLNVNNIRDIESDQTAGKISIPVRLGRKKAVIYHGFLLFLPFVLIGVLTVLEKEFLGGLLSFLSLFLMFKNWHAVQSKPSEELNPYLKQLAISSLIFVLLFGLGISFL